MVSRMKAPEEPLLYRMSSGPGASTQAWRMDVAPARLLTTAAVVHPV